MKRKWFSGILCAALLVSVFSPAALAAEEQPSELPEEDAILAELPEEEPAPEPSADEQAELPAEAEEIPAEVTVEEEAAAPADEPENDPDAAETPAEETAGPVITVAPLTGGDEIAAEEAAEATLQEPGAEEEMSGEEAPVEEGVYVDGLLMDPEDPLYARYVVGFDGDQDEYYYTDFITRPLNNETLHYGIDVSAWQGTINWSAVAASGVEFAIIRCAYRTVGTGTLLEDGRFVDYINGAKAAGIKVGVYIFSQAITVKEAEEEAALMLDLVKGYSIDLPLVFDLEHYSGGRFSTAGLSAREITDMCKAFCAKIEAAGYESMVYSNPTTLDRDIYENEIGRLWLAHYIEETWYDGHPYEYWQCTSSGAIDGIDGRVDLDFWFQPNGGSGSNSGSGSGAADKDSFSDVKTTDWFYESVMQAFKAGVVKGVSDTSFQPKGTATRGQVVTMIHRMAGTPSYKTAAPFTDLTQAYYKDAVNWAAEQKVVTGTSDTTFHPDKSITRQELVTILYRMAGSPAVTGDLKAYTDADSVASWAVDAMIWAVGNKIITGYEDATLRPKTNANRAEVCAILMRYGAL